MYDSCVVGTGNNCSGHLTVGFNSLVASNPMKNNRTYVLLAALLILDLALRLWNPIGAKAQSSTGVFETTVVSSLTQCAWLSGASVSNGVAFCFVNTGMPATSAMLLLAEQQHDMDAADSAAGGRGCHRLRQRRAHESRYHANWHCRGRARLFRAPELNPNNLKL